MVYLTALNMTALNMTALNMTALNIGVFLEDQAMALIIEMTA
jgi:hypothetical protein